MIEIGSRVRIASVDFEGRVLGRHGSTGAGGAFEYKSLPENLNLSVYAVFDETTGEVRYFSGESLELV
jgi:hypothetical protein